ncbi:hypothetical protein FB45DRAFT_898181 [Roridomyces roridus]|uniref:Uncharacterized protein n=1 Tax=Roridomyces roridus TaxID=1738132 RepID=A0AAD7CCF0_9AGAR|nr:hypothetical protein FB45DRAFT_898181 [Roridomyces roridus]
MSVNTPNSDQLADIFCAALVAAQEKSGQMRARLKEEFEMLLKTSNDNGEAVGECESPKQLGAGNAVSPFISLSVSGQDEWPQIGENPTAIGVETRQVRIREGGAERKALNKVPAAKESKRVPRASKAAESAAKARIPSLVAESEDELPATQGENIEDGNPRLGAPENSSIPQPSKRPADSASAAVGRASKSLKVSSAHVIASGSQSQVDPSPVPDPPTGFNNWHEFYTRHKLQDFAKFQGKKASQLATYKGRKHICVPCYRKNMPFLLPEGTKSCLYCRYGGRQHCNPPTPGSCVSTKDYRFSDDMLSSLAALHNAAVERGKEPGKWMGDGVPEFDVQAVTRHYSPEV